MRGSVENVDTTGTAPHFNHPDGSWRRMFITQPPCKCVRVSAETADRTDTDRFIVRYRDDDGVRLGGLYDAMVSGWSKDSFKKFDAMAWIPGYSKQGTEIEETTMEIDIKHGTAYWPEEAAFKDPVWIRYMADLKIRHFPERDFERM